MRFLLVLTISVVAFYCSTALNPCLFLQTAVAQSEEQEQQQAPSLPQTPTAVDVRDLELHMMNKGLEMARWQAQLFALLLALILAISGVGQYVGHRKLVSEVQSVTAPLKAEMQLAQQDFVTASQEGICQIENAKRTALHMALPMYDASLAVVSVLVEMSRMKIFHDSTSVNETLTRAKADLSKWMAQFAMLRLELGDEHDAQGAIDTIRQWGGTEYLSRLHTVLDRACLSDETKQEIRTTIREIREKRREP